MSRSFHLSPSCLQRRLRSWMTPTWKMVTGSWLFFAIWKHISPLIWWNIERENIQLNLPNLEGAVHDRAKWVVRTRFPFRICMLAQHDPASPRKRRCRWKSNFRFSRHIRTDSTEDEIQTKFLTIQTKWKMTVFRSEELAFLLFCFSPFSLSLSLLSSSLIYCEIACETTVVCTRLYPFVCRPAICSKNWDN